LNFLEIFVEFSNIKFHENPFSGNQVVPCRQTDTTKLMVTYHNFEKVPNNQFAFQNLMIKLPVHIWACLRW